MRLQDNPYFTSGASPELLRQLDSIYRQIAAQVNGVTEGRIAVITNAATAPPTAGDHVQGDWLRNSAPVEEGSAGSMYVELGWVCVVSGSPGTWVPCRVLTGA